MTPSFHLVVPYVVFDDYHIIRRAMSDSQIDHHTKPGLGATCRNQNINVTASNTVLAVTFMFWFLYIAPSPNST